MAGLVIELGKPSKMSKGKKAEGPDEYDAFAEEMLSAVKAGDAKSLAGLMRECSMLGPPMDEDEDY